LPTKTVRDDLAREIGPTTCGEIVPAVLMMSLNFQHGCIALLECGEFHFIARRKFKIIIQFQEGLIVLRTIRRKKNKKLKIISN